jgi:hypothetical protein
MIELCSCFPISCNIIQALLRSNCQVLFLVRKSYIGLRLIKLFVIHNGIEVIMIPPSVSALLGYSVPSIDRLARESMRLHPTHSIPLHPLSIQNPQPSFPHDPLFFFFFSFISIYFLLFYCFPEPHPLSS